MQFDVLTIFPDFFHSPLATGLLGKAIESGLVRVGLHDLRDWTSDRHRTVDDAPYGGGQGMVMKPEPLVAAIEALRAPGPCQVVLTSPQGRPFTQAKARELADRERVVFVCGRYEGVDERVRHYVDEELSIGDYVLTGGEYAALVVIDAVARLRPGVLGNADSAADDSFSGGLLEYPHYTRPALFRDEAVPETLLSGDHAAIRRWRREQALVRTLDRRPELVRALEEEGLLEEEDRRLLARLRAAQEAA